MPRNLPPFAALKAFEAAARNKSFRAAAQEACLTASAISHQIRALEEFLGTRLFLRERGKSVLTTAGKDYLKRIEYVFEILETATAEAARRGSDQSLRIHASDSLASSWLLPMLSDYQQRYPQIDLKIINSLEPLEFRPNNLDIAIRYGDGNWPGLNAELLMEEELFLVCSPSLVDKLPSMDSLEELAEHTLIHCSLNEHEWRDWFELVGCSVSVIKHRIDLDSRLLVHKAAAGGLGIGIGRASYAEEFFRDGTLTMPYPMRMTTGQGYYLVYPERMLLPEKTANFRDWLLSQASHQPSFSQLASASASVPMPRNIQ